MAARLKIPVVIKKIIEQFISFQRISKNALLKTAANSCSQTHPKRENSARQIAGQGWVNANQEKGRIAMAVKARCPNCKKLRILERFICDCGLNLKKARKAGKVSYYTGVKVNGRRRELPLGRSLANAKAEYRRLKHELHNTGTVQSRQKMTVDDYYRVLLFARSETEK